MTRRLLCAALLLGLAPAADAGKYNEILSVGDEAPAWSELPGVDGKKHTLADLKDKQVVVVVFTCNSCPVASDYEERIINFAREYAKADAPVALVAINVNKIAEDSLPKMQERAKEKGFNFPYLYDETQKIAKSYGAGYTPEFFVLDKARRVVYMGAMDDHSPPAKAEKHFLEDAVKAALKGEKPAVAETFARGCRVRYVRKR